MTTASYQDIDSFIRSQKDKLNKDKTGNGYAANPGVYMQVNQMQPTNQQIDYTRQQLDNYLTLSRNPSNDSGSFQFRQPIGQQPQTPTSLPLQPPSFPPPSQNQMDPYMMMQYQQSPSSPPPQQIQQQMLNNQGATKSNGASNNNDNQENFFNKFGSKYDAHKSKLKNDLQKEYKEYMQQKTGKNSIKKNSQKVSDEYYATLPLKGMDSAKKHSGSQENLNILNQPLTQDSRSKSNYDVMADRRLYAEQQQRMQQAQPQYDPNYDMYRARSVNNSFENIPQMMMRQQMAPVEAWQMSAPAIDPSLSDILRRPPVGVKTPLPPQFQSSGRVQFNDTVRYNQYSPPPQQMMMQPPQSMPQQPQYSNNSSYRNQQPSSSVSYQQLNNVSTLGKDAPFNFSEDQTKDLKSNKAKEYQEELAKQVREKQLKKQKEKDEQAKLDRKLLSEANLFNPYGRSGGGAPIKDKEGNIVADLSHVKADPEQYSPRSLQQMPPNFNFPPPNQYGLPSGGGGGFNFSNNMNQYNGGGSNDMLNFINQQKQQQQQFGPGQPGSSLNTSRSKAGEDGSSFARGGNGIFGEGKTEDQKRQEERYKADLQKQIEEKQRAKALEKEKIRLEEEKEQKRIDEQQRRIKAELEEEERKKKAKEEYGKKMAEDAKKLADEKKRQEANKKGANIKSMNKKLQNKKLDDGNDLNNTDDIDIRVSGPPPNRTEYRTNSPPVPAAAKRLNGGKLPQQKQQEQQQPPPPKPPSSTNSSTTNLQQPQPQQQPKVRIPKNKQQKQPLTDTTAEYYVTESRLNLRDINRSPNGPMGGMISENTPQDLINNFEYKKNENFMPKKPMIKKSTRPPSATSNSEVLNQLQNLKKHLHNEQIQVENELHNNQNRATVGQLADLHHNILNVRTPPDDSDLFYKNNRINREPSFGQQRTYRKDYDTPPFIGGQEPRTYFRENTVLLGDQKLYSDSLFSNDLQREANERQINRISLLQEDALSKPYDVDQLAIRQNQQRLKKLRDLEGDNLSLADPNDVLNKFLNRNTRQPSALTLNDDTWTRQPP